MKSRRMMVGMFLVALVVLCAKDRLDCELGMELGGQTHTETEEYIGLGKTIPVTKEGERLRHTVVVRAGVVAAALGREGVEPAIDPESPPRPGRSPAIALPEER